MTKETASVDRYLRDLIKIIGMGAAFASLPILVSLADLQPPWPPAVDKVSAALILISALAAWEWTRTSRVRVRRTWMIVALSLTVLGLFGYLFLYSTFVEDVPGSNERVIRGYACSLQAMKVYPNACPDLSVEALRDAAWDTSKLWTRTSITVVRLLLTASWLVFTAGLIGTVGSVVAGRKAGAARGRG